MNTISKRTHNMNESYLEPRVARLETGLEQLAKNVSEMAISIRETSIATSTKIDNLMVAVTNAQAPKKTDWSLFVSIGFFILALGSAIFWPLNKGVQDNKDAVQSYHESMVGHMKLDLHPVGEAKIQALMKDVDITRQELISRDAALDTKLQKETQLMQELVTTKIAGLDEKVQMEMKLRNEILATKLTSHERQDELEQKIASAELRVVKEKNDLYIEKLFGRVQELEKERIKVADNEHAELMQWRQKAMGLSSPNAVVPLMTREAMSSPLPSPTPPK